MDSLYFRNQNFKTNFMKQSEDALDQFIRSMTDDVVKIKSLEPTIEQQENYTKPIKVVIKKPEWDPWMDNPIEDIFENTKQNISTMITNFEEWTPEFSKNLQPVVIWLEEFFAGTHGNPVRGYNNPVTGPKLCKAIKERLNITLAESGLRQCIRETRFRGQVPIGGSQKGYYLIQTPSELESQIKSLEDRAEGNLFAARCLRNYDTKKLRGDVFHQLFKG